MEFPRVWCIRKNEIALCLLVSMAIFLDIIKLLILRRFLGPIHNRGSFCPWVRFSIASAFSGNNRFRKLTTFQNYLCMTSIPLIALLCLCLGLAASTLWWSLTPDFLTLGQR
jgi:hypothetical protein